MNISLKAASKPNIEALYVEAEYLSKKYMLRQFFNVVTPHSKGINWAKGFRSEQSDYVDKSKFFGYVHII